MGAQWGALFLTVLGVNENDYSRLWLFIALTGICVLIPLPWLYVVKEDELLKNREQVAPANDFEAIQNEEARPLL